MKEKKCTIDGEWTGTIFYWPCLPRKRILCLDSLYSSLMDFWPLGKIIIGLFLYEDFEKMIFWLVLKLEISYRVITS